MAAMPFHQESDEQPRAYDPRMIAERATRYYAELFQNAGEDDETVATLIATRPQDWHNPDVVVTASDAQRAVYSMARGKTTGTHPPGRGHDHADRTYIRPDSARGPAYTEETTTQATAGVQEDATMIGQRTRETRNGTYQRQGRSD